MAEEKPIVGGGVEDRTKPKLVRRVKPKKVVVPAERPATTSKRDKNNPSFISIVVVVVVVVILAIIGVLFGYTKDKIAKLNQDKESSNSSLQTQLKQLRDELSNVKNTADKLSEDNQRNKLAMVDLLEKDRTLPRTVDTADWSLYKNNELSFVFSYPKTWEVVNPIIKSEKAADDADAEVKTETVYLQPVTDSGFANAISIKTDYADFASESLKEKKKIFSELEALDVYDFSEGQMIYFINVDDKNNLIPTVLILTADNIYRASFNVIDKSLDKYLDYRADFEKIITTFLTKVTQDELDKQVDDQINAIQP